jgi:hypothetical protein
VNIWRVVVDGWFRESTDEKAKARRFNILLEADSSIDAFDKGLTEAEKSAPVGPQWLTFEVLSAAKTQLPFHIT